MKKIIKNKTNLRLVSDGDISRYSYNVFDIGGIKDSINKLDSFLKDSDNIDKIESGLGAATSIINAGLSNAKVADTSNIENAIRDFTNTPIERSSREALSNQWVNTVNPRDNYVGSDFTQSTGSKIGNTIGAAFSGALSGSKLGGLPGAIGGAIIGLGSGITGAIIGNNRAKKKADRLNRLATNAAQIRQGNYYASADYLDDIDMFNYLSNYKALGGYMDNLFSRGGYLGHTHGGIFDNGVTFINEGGTHEENPYGGVQSGVDNEGNPNLVEEGEVLYNDYVFSNRLYPTKDQLEQYGLPKQYDNWTFARIANELSKESEERSNDPISLNGLRDSMSKLRSLQEALRTEEQDSNIFDNGGDKKKQAEQFLTDSGYNVGDRNIPTEIQRMYLSILAGKQTYDENSALYRSLHSDISTKGGDDKKYGELEQKNIQGRNRRPSKPIIYEQLATSSNNNNDSDSNDEDTVVMDFQDGPNGKPKGEVKQNNPNGDLDDKKRKKDRIPIPEIPEISFRDLVGGSAQHGLIGEKLVPPVNDMNLPNKLDYEYQGLIDNRTPNYPPQVEQRDNFYDTTLRYAPILGNLLAYLGNSKDYSDVENFMQETANPRSVAFTPLGNYIRPEYISPWELSNPIERQASSTRGYLMNNAGNNRAAANAALVASDYNTLGLLGQALLQGKQYNNQQRIQAADFNRATDQYNSQGAMQAQASNMSLNQYGLQRALSEYQMRNNIDNAYNQARSQNITSLYDNLANVGRENFIMNQLNLNKALLYGLNRLGLSKYVG